MKDAFQLLTWFLEKEVCARNAVSILSASIALGASFVLVRGTTLLAELRELPGALPMAALGVLVVTFLVVSLLWSAVERPLRRRTENIASEKKKQQFDQETRSQLESLDPWQRQLVIRFVVEGRTQIEGYEIGEFEMAWMPQMKVFLSKGIIRQHNGGVFEIEPRYLAYLREHWNPQTGRLE